MTVNERKKGKITPISHALYILILGFMLIISALLQCADITFFGAVPDFCFALVCAIGFILGEKYGAIFGLSGGVLIWALGSGGISLSVILFALCGYLCGALPEIILRRNFLSYLVYTAMMGGIHLLFTLIYFMMLSESYEIWVAFGKLIIPEFILCVIFMIVAYGGVRLIYTLFKGKKKDSRV
jgi:rod shape-determining protein MreD